MTRNRSRLAVAGVLVIALGAGTGLSLDGAAQAAKQKQSSNKPKIFQNPQQSLIPDRPGPFSFVGVLDSTINIGKAMKGKLVTDVDVSIRVTHPDLDDLDFYLIAPNGTKVFLTGNHDGIADAATSYGAGAANCGGAPTTFSDETANFISDSVTGEVIEPGQIVSPWAATVQPEGFPLNVIDGGAASGRWILRVVDFAEGDVGVLHCWKLRIKPRNRQK